METLPATCSGENTSCHVTDVSLVVEGGGGAAVSAALRRVGG